MTLTTTPEIRALMEEVRGLATLAATLHNAEELLSGYYGPADDALDAEKADYATAVATLREAIDGIHVLADVLERLDCQHAGDGGFLR